MGHGGLHQVITKVGDEIRTFKLESLLKGLIHVSEGESELGLKPFPIGSTTRKVVFVGRLPGDFHIELLYSNRTFLTYLAEFLLIQEVGLVEEGWIALHASAIPNAGFHFQDFLGKSLMVLKDRERIEGEL